MEYAGGIDTSLQGRTKADIQASMQQVLGCGTFFAQHATLLLTHGGQVARAKKVGMKDLHEQCTLGDGAHRVLHIILEEALGFHPGHDMHKDDLSRFAILE